MIEFYVKEEPVHIGGIDKKLVLYKTGDWPRAMKDKEALEFSIQKWEWIAKWYNKVKLLWLAGETNPLVRDIPYNKIKLWNYDDTCALCDLYHHSLSYSLICIGCPVLKSTGSQACRHTPWYKHQHAITLDKRLEAAQEEVEFLKSLRKEI